MSGLSINHYLAPEGYPLERFLDDCVAAGATGVGITERALGEMPVGELKRHLSDRSLGVTSVNSAGFFLWSDPARLQRQGEINARLIEAAAELEADTLVTIGGGLHDYEQARPGDLQRARSTVADRLPGLIEAAARRNVRLGVEPMHPIRIPNKATLNTLGQTERLCEANSGLGFVLDVFHSWWDPDLEEVLARMVSRLRLVQLTGVDQPRDPVPLPTRCGLSEGLVDMAALIGMFERIGYVGRYEFELFAADLRGASVADTIRRAVDDFHAFSTSRGI